MASGGWEWLCYRVLSAPPHSKIHAFSKLAGTLDPRAPLGGSNSVPGIFFGPTIEVDVEIIGFSAAEGGQFF